MSQTNNYYKHSGKIGPLGPIYMIVFGVLAALVLGAIYGYAIFYIPFIYLNFFITLFFGAIVGYAIGLGGKMGKVRNSSLMLLFGFVLGVIAEYVGWVSWILAFSEQEAFLLNPTHMSNVLSLVAEGGAWTIFGWTPKGTSLYLIWLIEAVMIIGASTLVSWSVISAVPYCEPCGKWVENKYAFSPVSSIENVDTLKSQLESGDFSSLQALEKLDSPANASTLVEVFHCDGCNKNFYLTVKSVVVSVDSDNKEKKEETTVIENLIVSSDQFEAMKGFW